MKAHINVIRLLGLNASDIRRDCCSENSERNNKTSYSDIYTNHIYQVANNRSRGMIGYMSDDAVCMFSEVDDNGEVTVFINKDSLNNKLSELGIERIHDEIDNEELEHLLEKAVSKIG